MEELKEETKLHDHNVLEAGILDNLPEMPKGISKKEWHEMLDEYLDEKVNSLPDELIPEMKKVKDLVADARKEADKFIGLREAINLLEQEIILKEFKLLYFLETYYAYSINFSTEEKAEERFDMAISYSARKLDEEDFLAGVYPDYFEE